MVVAVSLVAASCSGSTASQSSARSSKSSGASADVSATSSDAAEGDLEADLTAAAEGLVGDDDGGGSFLIHRDDKTTAVAVGARNSDGDPITGDTEFHMASISKIFVATMVMQLVDEGTVDLDSPIKDYLPDLAIDGDPTVRQVLGHRSGFVEHLNPSFLAMVSEDPSKNYSPDEVLATVAGVPAGEPGGDFEYANTNYIVLGLLIETLTGDTIDEALQARVAEPLGLTHTRFTVGDSTYADDTAAPWTSLGELAGEPDFEYTALRSASWAAGSLVSTPGDLQQFLTALMASELTSESALEQMKPKPGEPYGLGIESGDYLLGLEGRPFMGHTGGAPGYVSLMVIEPETGTVLAMVRNNGKTSGNDSDLDPFIELL